MQRDSLGIPSNSVDFGQPHAIGEKSRQSQGPGISRCQRDTLDSLGMLRSKGSLCKSSVQLNAFAFKKHKGISEKEVFMLVQATHTYVGLTQMMAMINEKDPPETNERQ